MQTWKYISASRKSLLSNCYAIKIAASPCSLKTSERSGLIFSLLSFFFFFYASLVSAYTRTAKFRTKNRRKIERERVSLRDEKVETYGFAVSRSLFVRKTARRSGFVSRRERKWKSFFVNGKKKKETGARKILSSGVITKLLITPARERLLNTWTVSV